MIIAASSGYDWATFWTAAGTIVALAFGVWGICWPVFRDWRTRPKLSMGLDRASQTSSWVNNVFWIRVPIYNERGKRAAEEVEIFLEKALPVGAAPAAAIPAFLPIRIHWTHDCKPSCPRITSGAYRLLDLAIRPPDPPPLSFRFVTEPAQPIILADGVYHLTFILAAANAIAVREMWELKVLPPPHAFGQCVLEQLVSFRKL